MRGPGLKALVARIGAQVGALECLAQCGVLAFIAQCNADPGIARAVDACRRIEGLRLAACKASFDHTLAHQRRRRLHQGNVETLSGPASKPGEERCRHRLKGIQPGGRVDHQKTDPAGAALRIAVHRHHPGEGLDHGVGGRALRVGAVLAVAADRGVDEAGIECGECAWVQTQTRGHPGSKALEHDITLAGCTLHHLRGPGLLQVDHQAAFAAIATERQGRLVAIA